MADVGRHRSEQAPGEAVEPSVTDNDQIGLGLGSQLQQHVDRVAVDRRELHVLRTRRPRPLMGLVQDGVRGIGPMHLVRVVPELLGSPLLVAPGHGVVRAGDHEPGSGAGRHLGRSFHGDV